MALFESTFPPYVPFGTRNLRLQTPPMRGTDAAVVQSVWNLMLQTMNPGPSGSQVTVNGVYDVATQAAVRAIQSYFGLPADGVAGPNTYFVFGQGNGPNVTYGGPAFGTRELSQASTGGDVIVLQNRLNLFAPYATLLGGPASGSFGTRTASAVLAFKHDAVANGQTGLTNNAVVGSGTFDALWLYTFAGGRGLLPGSGRNGFDVAFVQTLLKGTGFYHGTIDGMYDAGTVGAVQAFQRAKGLNPDGSVGPDTFYALGLTNNNRAPGPFGLSWPSGKPPSGVTVCSVGLVTQTGDLHPYGEASLVVNEGEGFESLDVVANNMPSPSSCGAAYGAFAFTLVDPSTGRVFGRQLMTPLPGGADDWGGSLSVGVATIPKGQVTVYPTPAGSATGPYGPAVLAGNLANCH